MGDTLETIYTGTLTASSFTNNVATLFTTNSATRHAIKDIYVTQGETAYSIAGSLKINGTTVLSSLNSSVSGLAIVGPSEAVTVTTTSLPIPYEDQFIQSNGTAIGVTNILTIPTINGITAASNETVNNISSVTSGSPATIASTTKQVWSNTYSSDGGTTQRMVIKPDNGNDANPIYYYPNQTVNSFTTLASQSYLPNAYDGQRYIYYVNSAQWLGRLDVHTGTNATTHAAIPANASFSTYSRGFMMGNNYFVFWGAVTTANSGPFVYSALTGVVTKLTSTAPSTVVGASSGQFFGTETSDGKLYMVRQTTGNFYRIEYIPGETWGSTLRPVITIDLGSNGLYNETGSVAGVGDYAYYAGNNSNVIYKVDVKNGVALGDSGLTLNSAGSATNLVPNNSMYGCIKTPTASQISGRTYTIDPSVSLRITGVTST